MIQAILDKHPMCNQICVNQYNKKKIFNLNDNFLQPLCFDILCITYIRTRIGDLKENAVFIKLTGNI